MPRPGRTVYCYVTLLLAVKICDHRLLHFLARSAIGCPGPPSILGYLTKGALVGGSLIGSMIGCDCWLAW